MAGEDDPITPVGDMEDIAAAMRADLVRLQSFTNAGHGVFRDKPRDFLKVLHEFIGSCVRTTGRASFYCGLHSFNDPDETDR